MILLTGGTGFLGSNVLGRLSALYPDKTVYVLIRAKDKDHAYNRLKETNYSKKEIPKNIIPVVGDVSLENLGLDKITYSELISEVNSIYHSAANTHLNLDLENATSSNLIGTYNLLEFAKSIEKHPVNFKHVSTAYVAGNTTKTVCSTNLNLDTPFRNTYEETKAKAEELVQSYKKYFSVIIFRPSVIVGDSITGSTSAFNVLYIPARAIYTGLLKVIPAIPQTPFDVVPVDYVSRIIAESENMDFENGSCFHLTAGVGRESSPGQILDLLINAAGKYSKNNLRHKPIFAPQEFLSQESIQKVIHSVTNIATNIYHTQTFKHFEKVLGQKIPLLNQILPFIPYMISNPRFDTKKTLEKFGPNGAAPLFENYAETIFKFCIESKWGRVCI